MVGSSCSVTGCGFEHPWLFLLRTHHRRACHTGGPDLRNRYATWRFGLLFPFDRDRWGAVGAPRRASRRSPWPRARDHGEGERHRTHRVSFSVAR